MTRFAPLLILILLTAYLAAALYATIRTIGALF